MKKFLWLVLILVVPAIARPETDAKTLEFLKKLNLFYYCLQREGLKNFSCDATMVLTPAFKNNAEVKKHGEAWLAAMGNLRYKISLSNEGLVSVDSTIPASTGDPKTDQSILNSTQSFQTAAKEMVTLWEDAVVKPLHDDKDFASDCKIQNTADGFTVVIDRKDGPVTEFYDKKAQLLGGVGTMGKVTTKSQVQLTSNPKGSVISGLKTEMGSSSYQIKIKYQGVKGFLLPQEMEFEVMTPALSSSLDLVWDLSNYVINQ